MISKLKSFKVSSSEEGFTLMELIIVVIIIGVLAVIAIPIFMNQQKTSIVAGLKSDVRNTNLNIVSYLTKNPSDADLESFLWESSITPTGVGVGKYQIVRTNPQTSIIARGNWQGYFVLGRSSLIRDPASITGNNNIGYKFTPGTPGFGVLYDSKTGKITVTGS